MVPQVAVLRGDGASFARIQPAGFRLLAALDAATRALGVDLTITCGTEDHGPADPHTLGEAYDVRVRGLSARVMLQVVDFLQQTLDRRFFTVLLETPIPFTDPALIPIQYLNPRATAPHLHLQRKRGVVFPPVQESRT